jgi:hypothetical protein
MTGEFSGSTISVTRSGELNRSNLFKSQQQPTILFNIRAFNQATIIPLACDITLEVTDLGEYLAFHVIREAPGSSVASGSGALRIEYPSLNSTPFGEMNETLEFTYPRSYSESWMSVPVYVKPEVQIGEFAGWWGNREGTDYIYSGYNYPSLYVPGPGPDTVQFEYYAKFKTSAPTNTTSILTMQVCNSNSAKDDNFKVFLNGYEIGDLDLSQNLQVGGLFVASTNVNLTTDDENSDFVCPMELMQLQHFNPNILTKGRNKIEMVNTQNNNNGNYGTFEISYYEEDGVGSDLLINPVSIASLTFNPPRGGDQVLYFDLV